MHTDPTAHRIISGHAAPKVVSVVNRGHKAAASGERSWSVRRRPHDPCGGVVRLPNGKPAVSTRRVHRTASLAAQRGQRPRTGDMAARAPIAGDNIRAARSFVTVVRRHMAGSRGVPRSGSTSSSTGPRLRSRSRHRRDSAQRSACLTGNGRPPQRGAAAAVGGTINPLDARARPQGRRAPLELIEAPFDQLSVAQLVLHARRLGLACRPRDECRRDHRSHNRDERGSLEHHRCSYEPASEALQKPRESGFSFRSTCSSSNVRSV